MTRVYYKEAVGAFVVFDVTRVSTFEAVSKWKHDLDSKVKLANGSPIPSVLLANKCDQKKDNSNNTTLMDNFCKETGFLGWFETSAKVRNLHKPQVIFSFNIVLPILMHKPLKTFIYCSGDGWLHITAGLVWSQLTMIDVEAQSCEGSKGRGYRR